jgi:ATP-dependent helicase/nuclease subunit A
MYRTLQVTDKETGELRPVSYRDIVILLRTTSGWDEEFRKVLEEEGIPAYITSKTGYFSATEVQGLLQFLRVLDNPGQDIPLFGVMKSIFGGFSDEEIARIRIGRKDRSLYEAVEAVAYTASVPYVDHEANKTSNTETGNEANLTFDVKEYAEIKAASVASTTDEAKNSDQIDEWHSETEKLPIKCRNFINKVTEYRLRTAYTPISELLQQIATDHDYLPYVSALPSGSKRKANVEMLFTKAADFEKTSYVGLFHFVRYMEQLEKYDVDYGEAETLDENADVVRIMSIHKSKGLEFPIVFVAGLAKRFNRQDVNQALLMDIDLGLGVDYVNVEKRYRNRTLRRGILSKKLREDNLAEELRVLYVAMTRPKEKLILTACIDKAEEIWEAQKTWKHWHMSYFSFMNMSCMLDFIFQALPLPSMQVSIQTPGTLAAEQLEEQVHFHGRLNQLSQADQLANPATLAQISQNLSFRYPYKPLEHLYAKMTVSELKKASRPKPEEDALTLYQEKEVIPYIPAFCREKTSEIPIAAAVLKGNAYHKIMEWIDFDALYRTVFDDIPNTFRAFHEEMDRKLLMESLEHCIQQEQRLTEEYRSAIDLPELTAFFLTATAYRMWKAQISGKLFREQPFVYGIPANRLPEQIHKQNTTDQGTSIYATSRQSEHIQQQNITGKDADSSNTIRIPEQEQHLSKVHMTDTLDNTAIESSFLSQETVLIQGIIDAFLIEDNQIILIDYKTDQVRTPSQLRNRYALQMQYYEKALTKLMNLPVTHKVIYSFYLTQEIVLPDAT